MGSGKGRAAGVAAAGAAGGRVVSVVRALVPAAASSCCGSGRWGSCVSSPMHAGVAYLREMGEGNGAEVGLSGLARWSPRARSGVRSQDTAGARDAGRSMPPEQSARACFRSGARQPAVRAWRTQRCVALQGRAGAIVREGRGPCPPPLLPSNPPAQKPPQPPESRCGVYGWGAEARAAPPGSRAVGTSPPSHRGRCHRRRRARIGGRRCSELRRCRGRCRGPTTRGGWCERGGGLAA
jgi:hypothetical protein